MAGNEDANFQVQVLTLLHALQAELRDVKRSLALLQAEMREMRALQLSGNVQGRNRGGLVGENQRCADSDMPTRAAEPAHPESMILLGHGDVFARAEAAMTTDIPTESGNARGWEEPHLGLARLSPGVASPASAGTCHNNVEGDVQAGSNSGGGGAAPSAQEVPIALQTSLANPSSRLSIADDGDVAVPAMVLETKQPVDELSPLMKAESLQWASFTGVDAFFTTASSKGNGLCALPDAGIVVLSSQRDHRLEVYEIRSDSGGDGVALVKSRVVGERGRGLGQFEGPRKLARVPGPGACSPPQHVHILVVDSGNHRVQELEVFSGCAMRQFQIDSPHGVACDGSIVAVSQPQLHRITLLDYLTSNVKQVIECAAALPSGVRLCSRRGSVIAAHASSVQEYSVTSGNRLREIAGQSCGLRDARDVMLNGGPGATEVLVADTGNNRIVRVDISTGAVLSTIVFGVFKAPSSLAVDESSGRLFLAHAGAKLLSVLTPLR